MSSSNRDQVKDLKIKTLPDIILPNDPDDQFEDNQDPMTIVAKVEERVLAEKKRNSRKNVLGTDRHYAKLLHREADQLHLRLQNIINQLN